ncbi:MAG: guanine deaminase, partial [Ancalomicrobiaceae bacterium]|nr:guanine deaminase [Ancalomicrobiaceae bacterium]
MSELLFGRTLSFHADPGIAGERQSHDYEERQSHDYEERGAIVIGDDGRILWSGARAELPVDYRRLEATDYGDKLITAGFIDAHVHFPQYRMLAAPGNDLLDWLNRFTFPEEACYGDRSHAETAAALFLDRLVAHGTTSALVFSSVHKTAADALFAAAEARDMALVTGKTMMDRNAPANVCDDAETGARDSEDLLAKWHGRGRARYAITPRFAITSTEAQLEASGALLKAHPDCLMQTHLSEQKAEMARVAELFPNAKDYTDVYDRFGLLGPTSLFGHSIHLSERECARLSETGSAAVHCPTSNTFLGSGLFDLDLVGRPDRPVGIGLATDVGGGTSYSMLHTIGEARKVAQMKGRKLTALRGFYFATLGNARLMKLDAEIGSLSAGKFADLVVLDPRATPVTAARDDLSETLEDRLFALAMLGDDRAV